MLLQQIHIKYLTVAAQRVHKICHADRLYRYYLKFMHKKDNTFFYFLLKCFSVCDMNLYPGV